MFLFSQLKLIEISKQTFVMDVKQGRETIIPKMFRTSTLPQSFQYYDPLISILNKSLDGQSKYHFNIQRKINSVHIANSDP